VAIVHGANLDQLGRRNPDHYGALSFVALTGRIAEFADRLELEASFFQTNHEGAFVEYLHEVQADGLVLNPGAWTHYSYAIRDALELTGLPAVEVHLSDIKKRETFRHTSVISDLCIAQIAGKGPDGYLEALQLLKEALPR
jgi:3-dehydroquinate dehydratase-2